MGALELIAAAIGYAGTLCLVLSFQCRSEKALFFCQTMSGALFVIHYGLLGNYTGMAMDAMCFIRALMMASGKKLLTGKPAMFAILAVTVGLCVLTWEDIFSVFPTVALIVSTVFLFSGSGKLIRRAQFFCTSPAWMVYNIKVTSIPGIICEALDMGSVAVYWIRTKKRDA